MANTTNLAAVVANIQDYNPEDFSREDKIRLYAYGLTDVEGLGIIVTAHIGPPESRRLAREAISFAIKLYGDWIISPESLRWVVTTWNVNPAMFTHFVVSNARLDLWETMNFLQWWQFEGSRFPFIKVFQSLKARHMHAFHSMVDDWLDHAPDSREEMIREFERYMGARVFPENAHLAYNIVRRHVGVGSDEELRIKDAVASAINVAFGSDDYAFMRVAPMYEVDADLFHRKTTGVALANLILTRGLDGQNARIVYVFAAKWVRERRIGDPLDLTNELLDFYGEDMLYDI